MVVFVLFPNSFFKLNFPSNFLRFSYVLKTASHLKIKNKSFNFPIGFFLQNKNCFLLFLAFAHASFLMPQSGNFSNKKKLSFYGRILFLSLFYKVSGKWGRLRSCRVSVCFPPSAMNDSSATPFEGTRFSPPESVHCHFFIWKKPMACFFRSSPSSTTVS